MQAQLGDLDGCQLVIDSNTPPRDALEQASCYLATAKDLLYGIAADSTDAKLWGVFQLLEIGKSMLDATVTNPALSLKTEV
jgi:hypothetical protein